MSKDYDDPKTMQEAYDSPASNRLKWAGFVEGDVVSFFDAHNLEKLQLEDGEGNKAKLARTKDNSIKIEYTSSVVL